MRVKLAVAGFISLVVVLGVVLAQSGATYTPGDFQSANPYYPIPNPFYFEGKINWDKLGIDQPKNTWEYMERGMHRQDDLGDIQGAIQDYQSSLSMNSLQNGTCQIVTAATMVNGALPSDLEPAPCMFTVRLRLGYILQGSNPQQAISLFQEVLKIDPLKLGVNTLIGETYMVEAGQTQDVTVQEQAYQNALQAFQAELALSPVTPQTIALTADQANNSRVHWDLAAVYEKLGQSSDAISELQKYLLATQWHSDVYPWRIELAKKQIQQLQAGLNLK
jgi:tetratricopeptide (TPR) repeat protein